MKLFKKLRKGFTLIELVVVIAVIAILSAVSVVSYVAITNRAKQSADEQAVKSMNTALKASSILGAKDITELFDALAEEGLDAKNYKPLMKDTYFFWDQEDNQIVYAKYKDNQYVGIYPEAYKDKTKGTHHWFSLSKEIQTVKVAETTDKKYTVSSAEELYTILSDERTVNEVKLSDNVDLMGADITFSKVTSFDGNDKKLENLSQLKHNSFQASQNENKDSGLFGKISSTETIEIKNVTIENSVIGSAATGSCGIIAGSINGGANVILSDVHIKNSTVYATQKGGLLVGYLNKGSLTINSDVTIEGCKVATVYGEAGKLVGSVGGATLVNNIGTNVDVTLEMLPNDFKKEITAETNVTITKNPEATDSSKKVSKLSSGYFVWNSADSHNSDAHPTLSGQKMKPFRMFNKDALFTITNKSTATYNSVPYKAYAASDVALEGIEGHPTAVSYGAVPVLASML